jgi:uncharacterized membrane protein
MFNQVNQMMWHYMGWWAILFWVLVIGGLAYLFWLYRPRGGYRPIEEYRPQEDPVELARLRYARGEISEEEFDKIVKKIREG